MLTNKEIFTKIYIPGMGGWQTVPDREWIAGFLSTLDYERPVIVEVGVYYGGASLIFWRSFPNCVFHAIDNWSEAPLKREGFLKTVNYVEVQGFEDLNFSHLVTIHDGDSVTIGEKWDTPIDLLFIDANHFGEYPSKDIQNFGKWVKVGGYILLDDAHMSDVRRGIDIHLRNNANWQLIRDITEHNTKIMAFKKIG